MRKGLRNLLLGAVIALPLGAYAHRAYQDYKIPEQVSMEKSNDGMKLTFIRRHKSNFVFDTLERIVGTYDENRKSYSNKGPAGDGYVFIDIAPFEENARDVDKYWSMFEDSKGRPDRKGFNPSRFVVYNSLKDLEPSKRRQAYFDMNLNATKVHEDAHLNFPKNAKNTEVNQEKFAYLNELATHPLYLSEILKWHSSKSSNDNIYKRASAEIIGEFLKYSDTPDIYSLVNLPNFQTEIPKRAREILKKEIVKEPRFFKVADSRGS